MTSSPRKLLVLINPSSGHGKAVGMFHDRVLPRLAACNIECHVVVTTSPNHARELCETLDLSRWTDLCVVSGDGLLFEVVNGLLCHPDPEAAMALPIGIIPAGSGNGILATTLAYQGMNVRRRSTFERGAIKSLIVAQPNPFPLLHIETRSQSFASVGVGVMWGFLSDCDIESEKYRSLLGGRRFVAQALVRLANLRKYRGRISFLRADVDLPGKPQVKRYPLQADCAPVEPNPARKNSYSTRSSQTRERLNSVLSSKSDVDMPGLQEPVPDHWEVLDTEFLFVCIHSVSHLATDILAMSSDNFTMDSGHFFLTVLRASQGRLKMVHWLTKLETGEVYYDDALEMIPIRAFRLEPTGTREGIMTVDGELVKDPGMIQGYLTNWKSTIMGPGPSDSPETTPERGPA